MNNINSADGFIESRLLDGGYISVTKGNSMRPLFKTNRDVVKLASPASEPKKYDVVLYKISNSEYVLHRIVGVKADEFLIRGDNTYKLEHIKKERILAVLIEFNRKGKPHKVTDISYRIYSRAWNLIYPLRFVMVRSYALLRKILRKNK